MKPRTAAEAVEQARARGAVPHVVDGTGARTKRETLARIAAALSFPDYFGHNLDALHDCLVDLSWLAPGEHVLVWADSADLRAADPAAHRAIAAVLDEGAGPLPDPDRTLTVVRLR